MRKQYKIFVAAKEYAVGDVIKLTHLEKIYSEGYLADARRAGPMGLKNMSPHVPVFMATPFSGRFDALAWFMPSQFKIGVYTGIAKKLKGGKGYRVVWGRINEGLVIELVDQLTKKLIGRFTDCYPSSVDMGSDSKPAGSIAEMIIEFTGILKPDKEVRFDG